MLSSALFLKSEFDALNNVSPGPLKHLVLPHVGEDGAFLFFGEMRREGEEVAFLEKAKRGVIEEGNLEDLVLGNDLDYLGGPNSAIHILDEYDIFEPEFKRTVHL